MLKYFLLICLCFFSRCAIFAQKIAGPLLIENGIAEGYTLFAPLNSKSTYLIDNCGRIINEWTSDFFPGNTAYLLPNGNLLRTKRLATTAINGGGGGGGVEIFDWDSNLKWSFELNTDVLRLHHDVKILPNGNVLMIVWEAKTRDEALAVGRNPDLLPANGIVWSEQIIEVKPLPPNNSEIVWRWSLWDHLVQDFDETKQGFGVVSDHPELVDVNYVSSVISDWIHANALDYNAELDQIVLSSPFLNEFWIIDHSTTTTEAASHSGGISNRGGDLLYRWGNPEVYKRGSVADRKIFGQHDVHWVTEGPYEGQIILFNNNAGVDFSSVDIINPPLNESKTYDISENVPYLPLTASFSYRSTPKEKLFSQIMAGAEILPNGNLLICSSRQGVFFEVTPAGDTVWFYKSPVTTSGIVGRDVITTDPNYNNDLNFRTIKYPITYSAFSGRTIVPQEPIEGEPWACGIVTDVKENDITSLRVYPNPSHDFIIIEPYLNNKGEEIVITDVLGRVLNRVLGKTKITVNISQYPSGLYLINQGNQRLRLVKK